MVYDFFARFIFFVIFLRWSWKSQTVYSDTVLLIHLYYLNMKYWLNKKKNTLYDNLKTCINKKDLLKPDKVKFVKQNKKWLLIDFW